MLIEDALRPAASFRLRFEDPSSLARRMASSRMGNGGTRVEGLFSDLF